MSTAKKLKITDDDISQVLSLREMKKRLSKKLENIDFQLKQNEKELIELIECGCELDSSFNISINESFKRYPRYKDELEKRLGEKIIKEIIDSTEPQQFKKLVIAS
jgi:hypothetical protein